MIDEHSSALQPELSRWRQTFISDVFHTLAQPLTALHCSLEIALVKNDPQQCGASLSEALAATERLIATTAFLRESAYADDPGVRESLDLGGVLLKVVEELRPVAEAGGVRIETDVSAGLLVHADSAKLEQALFLLLNESVSGNEERGVVRITGGITNRNVTVHVSGRPTGKFDRQSQGMQVMGKVIRAAMGIVESAEDAETFAVTVRLPGSFADETLNIGTIGNGL